MNVISKFFWGFLAFFVIWAAAGGADNASAQTVPERGSAGGPSAIAVPQAADSEAERYISIDEIEPGMRGYGLTVFAGTKVERFAVVAVSVTRNLGRSSSGAFNAKRNAIIIRCDDDRFRLGKMVQGVSGSPIYFDDRLAGAMAFGWASSEEPLYGVTPIGEMLEVRQSGRRGNSAGKTSRPDGGARAIFDSSLYHDLMREVLLEESDMQRLARAAGLASQSDADGDIGGGLVALPLALATGGLSGAALEYLHDYVGGLNWGSGLPAGRFSAGGTSPAGPGVTLTAGATLTIPLVTGDMSMAVLGTVTTVVGNEVYAFGHSWNGDGPVSWPMGTGYIHTFVNRKTMSFKLGEALDIVGTIGVDETAAVYGEIGDCPTLTPMTIKVNDPLSGYREEFVVEMAQDELAGPFLAATVAASAILQRGGLPRKHTLKYHVEMDLDGVDRISFDNISSGVGPKHVIDDVLSPLALLLNNPWKEVKVTGAQMEVSISDEDSIAVIKSARLGRRLYRPGETVRVQLTLEPWRRGVQTYELTLPLPKNLAEGTYKINVGGEREYRQQLRTAQPQRYRAFNAGDVQRILLERLCLGRNNLYMAMILPGEGLALENESLPALPPSRAMMLTDKSRRRASSPFRPLAEAQIATDFMVVGGESFEIEVREY